MAMLAGGAIGLRQGPALGHRQPQAKHVPLSVRFIEIDIGVAGVQHREIAGHLNVARRHVKGVVVFRRLDHLVEQV